MATPRTMVYQGFELTARPLRLKSGKWTAVVRIRRNKAVKDFSANRDFDTEDEAVVHALDFGRKLVDGAAPEVNEFWIS